MADAFKSVCILIHVFPSNFVLPGRTAQRIILPGAQQQ